MSSWTGRRGWDRPHRGLRHRGGLLATSSPRAELRVSAKQAPVLGKLFSVAPNFSRKCLSSAPNGNLPQLAGWEKLKTCDSCQNTTRDSPANLKDEKKIKYILKRNEISKFYSFQEATSPHTHFPLWWEAAASWWLIGAPLSLCSLKNITSAWYLKTQT